MSYLHYPKWVGAKIVNSLEEEAELLGVRPEDIDLPPGPDGTLPPGYVPQEYPKWVAGRIVNSAEEEAALMAEADAYAEVSAEAALRTDEAPKRRGRPPKAPAEASAE